MRCLYTKHCAQLTARVNQVEKQLHHPQESVRAGATAQSTKDCDRSQSELEPQRSQPTTVTGDIPPSTERTVPFKPTDTNSSLSTRWSHWSRGVLRRFEDCDRRYTFHPAGNTQFCFVTSGLCHSSQQIQILRFPPLESLESEAEIQPNQPGTVTDHSATQKRNSAQV